MTTVTIFEADRDQAGVKERATMNPIRSPRLQPSPANSSSNQQFRLYFIPKGAANMSHLFLEGNEKMEGLKERARNRGAEVLDSLDLDNNSSQQEGQLQPTHLIVCDRAHQDLEPRFIAEAVGFTGDDAVQKLSQYLGNHRIQIALRKWVAKGNKYRYPPFQQPKPAALELYYGVLPDRSGALTDAHQKTNTTGGICCTPSPSSKSKRSRANFEDIDDEASMTSEPRKTFNNLKLSDVFHKLSKAYQSAQLEDIDAWRSYTFHLVSGRVKRLPEITYENISDLNNIPAVGAGCVGVAKEFLETGRCTRLTKLESHPQRKAVREFMNIWGVGPVKARQLAVLGYTRIRDVRNAISGGILKLDRNALIGVEIYEDIQEDMTRKEVELIFAKVRDAVQCRLQNAEMQIMGSYRRGKDSCGDVDILITHPDYVNSVPPRLLGEVVDDLREAGEIAHHLTFLCGMSPEKFETLPPSAAEQMTKPKQYGRSQEKKSTVDKKTSSYMGVFFSPVNKNKRRRVDIKFYPYRERIFASLYFTGSGHFNRSMRLWATRKKNLSLSDHGLFKEEKGIKTRIDFYPATEKEVFDKIGICWKEPHERDGFDAVEGHDGGVLEDMTQSELTKEIANHTWIE